MMNMDAQGRHSSQQGNARQEVRPQNYLSAVRGEKNVLIVSGFAGAGKTTVLENIALGLGTERSKIAVIVNEIGGASTRVDLDRLTEDLSKLGISGCACCASNAQVLAELAGFQQMGKKLVVIEQSGLSRTGELAQTIKREGYNPYVVTVLNPHQLSSTKRYNAPHCRASDAIFFTHVNSSDANSNAALQNAQRFVAEITEDINPKPKGFILGSSESRFPSEVWEDSQRSAFERAKGIINKVGTLINRGSGRIDTTAQLEAARQLDVQNFVELEVILYPNFDLQRLPNTLANLTTNDGKNVAILRAKGVIQGKNIDIVVDERGLNLNTSNRTSPSTAFDGNNYLVVRSLSPDLKKCWKYISTNLGTPECALDAVKAVGSLYPTLSQLQSQLQNENHIPVLFGADTLLWELSDALAHISNIPDKTRQGQLALSVANLAKIFLDVRINVMDVLCSEPASRLPDLAESMFNFSFVASRILVHPQLERMIAGQPALARPAEALWRRLPVTNMLHAMSSLRTLAINGLPEISTADIAWMKLIIEKGAKIEGIDRTLIHKTFQAVSRLASASRNRSWADKLSDLQSAFGIN